MMKTVAGNLSKIMEARTQRNNLFKVLEIGISTMYYTVNNMLACLKDEDKMKMFSRESKLEEFNVIRSVSYERLKEVFQTE